MNAHNMDIAMDSNNLERLIVDMKESLERQIHGLEATMAHGFARIDEHFGTQNTRLDRHGSLLQTGSRWTNRMNAWAEKTDQGMNAKDERIARLEDRVAKLERDRGPIG